MVSASTPASDIGYFPGPANGSLGTLGLNAVLGRSAGGRVAGYLTGIADIDGDLKVNAVDLGILLGDWGLTGDTTLLQSDLNGDGAVGSIDLGILIGSFDGAEYHRVRTPCVGAACEPSGESEAMMASLGEGLATALGFEDMQAIADWLATASDAEAFGLGQLLLELSENEGGNQ